MGRALFSIILDNLHNPAYGGRLRLAVAGFANFLFCCFAITARAESMPDGHAPIGVMGDHAHRTGEWMLSYRYSHMGMNGARDGDSRVSTQRILADFMVAPLRMDMDMHMLGAMYGLNDAVTLQVMAPYMHKSMKYINRMGARFETKTEGIGDVSLGGVVTLARSGSDRDAPGGTQALLANIGVSLPTGATDERADTPAGANQKLPYAMQLGSGTYDANIGATYVRHAGRFSQGAQIDATIRTGKNNEGYRLGNEYRATAWAAANAYKIFSFSARLAATSAGDIHGRDRELNPMMAPMARGDLRGGETVEGALGVNFFPDTPALKGQRLAAEFSVPLYRRLDGPQLEQDYRATLGWQYAF